jgi:anaerobic selenocysteine-containing dehydrogenase
MRLLALLKSITGNLDIRGGDLFTPRPKLKDITKPLPEPSVKPVGQEKFPLFCQTRKEGHSLCLPEAILEERPYPIRGMIIAGGNPSLEWPDSRRVRKALTKLKFLLIIDIVRSPDCKYADVVLPACTFLERDEHRVNAYQNLPHISLRRKVTEPVGGLADQMIWSELAEYMGFGKYFPWRSCEEGIDHLLGDLGLTYRSLVSQGGIFQYEKRTYKKYEINGFNTPSGKVEVKPEPLKSLGIDSEPLREKALEPDKQSDKFPLVLITGGNLLCYTHWQYRYLHKLRKMSPEPVFEIHPNTATKYFISDGDMAEVRTKIGKIQIKAHLSNRVLPDTIHIPQGWEEANVNELTGSEEADPISGFPNLKSLRCGINKL